MSKPSSCPICAQPLRDSGLRAPDRMVTGEGPFAIFECPECEYGVTIPQLSDKELAPYYSGGYYEDLHEHSGRGAAGLLHRLRDRYRRRSAARRHRRPPLRLDGVEPGRVLDVGCGSGELLADFAARGWETYGIDPGAEATAAAARRGAQVHTGTLADQPWPQGNFELIVFQHSLEHIVDPLAALRRAQALLAPGGLVVVAVPNWASWQRRLFRGRWVALDLPRHQQHFSPRAFERLAPQLDLEAREVGTDSTPVSVAYSIHCLIAGHWTPGWKLWLAYAVSLPLLPFVLLGDRLGGGDACHAVLASAE